MTDQNSIGKLRGEASKKSLIERRSKNTRWSAKCQNHQQLLKHQKLELQHQQHQHIQHQQHQELGTPCSNNNPVYSQALEMRKKVHRNKVLRVVERGKKGLRGRDTLQSTENLRV